ncbi:MAG: hypothetical protein CTY19_06925 [Methylomonas sp.]|nr:MAG: hypothetical protein CTY19_06925 [Methylomonas sp.]
MHYGALLILTFASLSAHAEVFKCVEKFGKTSYQAKPCNQSAKEQQLEIKSDPEKEAAAKAKLGAIQDEYDTRKTEKEKIDKELAEQQRATAELEIARRNVIAQQEQADAQRRQAEALEKQNRQNNRPIYVLPGATNRPVPLPQQPRL